MWLLLAWQDAVELTFDDVRAAQSGSIPERLLKLDGRWVTLEGYLVAEIEDGRVGKLRIAEERYSELSGTPPTPFTSVRLAFRPGAAPADILDYQDIRVSGRWMIRREYSGGKLTDLFWIVDAVEGRRSEPPPSETPPLPARATSHLSFSLLEKGRPGSLPDDLRALDGRWVTVSGNLLVFAPTGPVTEFQLGKNPWDGCCLGIPPTPYDSVRVRLRRGTTLSNPYARLATVSGTFRIRPETIQGEVVSMYEIEEAVEGASSSPVSGFPSLFAVVLTAAGGFLLGAFLALRVRARRT